MKQNKAESRVRSELKRLGFKLSSQKDEKSNGTDIVAFKRRYRDWETDRKSTRLNSSH